jgi:restriction endonuclease S subunit
MGWQTIVKENNLAVSEKTLSDVLTLRRFDAEYFQPEYLEYDECLSKKSAQSISNLVTIADGNHLGISQYFTEDENGIPYYRGQDVNNFFLEASNPLKIPEEIYAEGWMRRSYFQSNDILLSIVGTVGSLSFVTDRLGKATGSCKIAILRPKDVSETKPLVTFLLSKYGQYQLKRMTRGAVQTGIILEDIPFISVPVIPNKLKEKITMIVDKAIEVERSARLAFIEAEKLLLKEINLEGYVPSEENTSVRELTECLTDNRFDAEYWEPRFDEILDRIKSYSEGCSTIKDEFSQIKNGFKFDPEKLYRYVEIGDVNVSTGEVSSTELEGKELPTNAKITLEEKQLVTSKVRPNRGATAILDNHKGYIASGAFVVLKETGKVTLETLQVYLKTPFIRDLLLRYNTGTAYPTIVDTDILNLPLPLVSRGAQEAITEKVKQCGKERTEAKELLEKSKRAVEIFIEKDEQVAKLFLGK